MRPLKRTAAYELIAKALNEGGEAYMSIVSPKSDPASDLVSVGSIESEARGQGARKNVGKPQWWQVPWWTIDQAFRRPAVQTCAGGKYDVLDAIFDELMLWQRGGDRGCLDQALRFCIDLLHRDRTAGDEGTLTPLDFEAVARVLEFGAKKYAVGNWTKGMPWSVCLSCAFSHLFKAIEGQTSDEESGLSHVAHLACNLMFLIAYHDIFPEGDDRLPGFRAGGVKNAEVSK